jgi:glutathione synthase/RimK-type ligase-like ATP-grasp enzyme
VSLGSKILTIQNEIPDDLKVLSMRAAASISATLDVLDIIKTERGYCVIEHNPTPNFTPDYQPVLGYNVIDRIIDNILEDFKSKCIQ